MEEQNRDMDSGLEDLSSDYDENENAEREMPVENSGGPPEMNRPGVSHHYDTGLPSLHSYLGPELEVVRGRTVLEEKDTVMLHLLRPLEVVLMPGQTLPLSIFDSVTIDMLRACLHDDRTFGVLASWTHGPKTAINAIGTTAEIFEYLPEEENAGFRIKAKARQRFRMLDSKYSCKWKAKVKILPEVRLSDPLENVKLQSLYRHRTSTVNRHRFRRMDAAVTHWPAFVFEQYNVNRLIRDIKSELNTSLLQEPAKKEKDNSQMELTVPEDPTELSFWVAQNVPMLEEHRLRILELNSPIQRLRFELKSMQQALWNIHLQEPLMRPGQGRNTTVRIIKRARKPLLSKQLLCCNSCGKDIGSRSDVFAMSVEGPQGTYVNPGGYLYETMTLHKVRHIISEGRPSTEFSWFPGYAWTICKCKYCNQHMGWKFRATKSHLRPIKFWGISRRSIKVDVKEANSNTLFC